MRAATDRHRHALLLSMSYLLRDNAQHPLSVPRATSSFFFQAEDGIRDVAVTGVQTCALPIWRRHGPCPDRDRETVDLVTEGREPDKARGDAARPAASGGRERSLELGDRAAVEGGGGRGGGGEKGESSGGGGSFKKKKRAAQYR